MEIVKLKGKKSFMSFDIQQRNKFVTKHYTRQSARMIQRQEQTVSIQAEQNLATRE